MRGRIGTSVIGMLSVALVGTGLSSTVGGADERSTYYIIDVAGHPFEPYAELPTEVTTGTPSTYVELQEAPLPIRCESISSLFEPSVLVDGIAFIVTEGRYNNPSKATAINPADSRPTKAEVSTVPNGPRALADCKTDREGMGQGTFGGFVSEAFSVQASTSDSYARKLPDQQVVEAGTVNKLRGLTIGDLAIETVETKIDVRFPVAEEPTVKYSIHFAGVSQGGKFNGGGEEGFYMAGEAKGGKEFVEQFNKTFRQEEKGPFFELVGKYGLRAVEPRFYVDPKSGRDVFEVSVGDGTIGLAARRNQQVGHGFGMRLAAGRVGGKYDYFG